ncbi:MAG: RidA family protein [Pirellulaceae bacterium]
MSAEANFEKLNLQLPPAPKPAGVYKPIVMIGNVAYLSGHGPLKPDGSMIVGRVGEDLDKQEGYEAARQVGLALLATMKANLGSLDRVKRVIKVLGFVRSTDAFDQQPAVINGCSELFRDVFGEDCGVGARSALGTNTLPGGIAVEIEAIIEIET